MKSKLKYLILIIVCSICPVIIAKPSHHKTIHRNHKPKAVIHYHHHHYKHHHHHYKHHTLRYIWVAGHYETQITISGIQIQVWIPGKYILIK
jgi:hypothetical protein